jgi:hypothetical protein
VERLIREIRAAKKRGVNVDEVFVDYEGRLKKLDTLLMGVRWAIVFTFLNPILLYSLKAIFVLIDRPLELPEKEMFKFFVWNASAMVAYGFGSGITALVHAARKKSYEKFTSIAMDLASDLVSDDQSSTSGRSKAQESDCDSQSD